jgi:alanine dehydrogenase
MLPEADLVIGAVLVPGARAPHVVTSEQLKLMKPNAVLVDVSFDQGGCFETSRPTTHSDPTYVVYGVTHYCVANMPGAVPITSTYALTNATIPYLLRLADQGVGALRDDAGFLAGLNVIGGRLTYEPVARDQGLDWIPAHEALDNVPIAA